MQINYITKMRAFRYAAAAEKEWLYPEKYLPSTHWRKLDDEYLLMPEPRDIHMGGEIIIGYKDGSSDAFSEYGHKPWQRDYKNAKREREESIALQRFKAEFARMQGPAWRGTSYQFGDKEPHVDREEFHNQYLEKAKRFPNADRRR